MLKKARHIAMVFGLLLCITLSFAWMTELDNTNQGRFLYLHYDKSLYSAANEMDAWLYHLIEPEEQDGEVTYEDITNRHEDSPEDFFTTNNFAPGEYRLFAIKLQNKTTSPMSVSVNLAKIDGDPLFWEHINVGILGSYGFSDEYPAPMIEEFPMADRSNSNGDVSLAKLLELPPLEDGKTDGNVVEIRFYIRFSHTAVNELQNKVLTIGVVNVLAA
ncbi:MAG: hypothetical protein IJC49_06445 [Clostridia bacterium]|nr:hypothetical protein [Clostridia bacterium]